MQHGYKGRKEQLKGAGARVTAFDPWVNVDEAAQKIGVHIARSFLEASTGADAIVLVTPHPEFLQISFKDIAQNVAMPCGVVDGRRAFVPNEVTAAGFRYCAVGLGVRDTTNGET